MIDLKEMIQGENNLNQCKEQINLEFESISKDNLLKRAVLLMFFADKAMEQLKNIDTKDFMSKVKEEMDKVEAEFEGMKNGITEHTEQNKKVLAFVKNVSGADMATRVKDIQEKIKEAEKLIKDSDEKLKVVLQERDKLNLEDLVAKQQETDQI